MISMNKRQLRTQLRSLHEGKAVRDAQSAGICRQILDSSVYRNAHIIGGYMPLAHEADITPVLLDALCCGKKLVLPLCGAAPNMTLRQVSSMEELIPGAYGIMEPSSEAPIVPPQCVDLLLVPLEGIDRTGFRLGKGGGYYDCLLSSTEAVTIGCALSWQWVDEVPREPWDRRLSACADMLGMHEFKQ